MKKQCFWFVYLTGLVVVLLLLGSRVYAQDIGPVKAMAQRWQADRTRVEAQLGLDPQWYYTHYRHATSYYDDLVDHYEQCQMVADHLGDGLPQP